MSTSSQVASHCSIFALSDSTDLRLKQQCDHSHDELCEQCESLHSTLHKISAAIEDASFSTEDDKDEALYLTSSAMLAIQSWKCHLLRSTHQDQARLDVIDALDSETVFVVNDWAMKLLPQRYRESQTDWFGKRGISWHISVGEGTTLARFYTRNPVLQPGKLCNCNNHAPCTENIEARAS